MLLSACAQNKSLGKEELKKAAQFYIDRGREALMTLLTMEEKKLLERAASLIDELMAPHEVVQDSDLVKDLKIALRDMEKGKTMPLDELVRELGLEGKV